MIVYNNHNREQTTQVVRSIQKALCGTPC